MKYFKHLFCIWFIISISTQAFSLTQQAKPDESEISLLFEKCEKLRVTNTDSAILIAQHLFKITNEGDNVVNKVRAEHMLGYCYYSKNDYSSALKYFNQSLELARQNNLEVWISSGLNRIGNVYQLQSNYVQAFDIYKQALEINQKLENKTEIARTLVNLGSVYNLFGSYQKSIEYFLKALALYEGLNDKEGVAWTSLSIARLFKRLGLYEKAMQYAEPALNNYRELESYTGSTNGITLSLTELGNIYFRLGLYDKAIENTQTVLKINIRNRNVQGQAANHLSLGIICFEKGDMANAERNLLNAIDLKKQVKDSLDLPLLYRYLGETYIQKNNLQKGIEYIYQSLAFAQKKHLLLDVKDSYNSLSKAQSRMGNYLKALEYQTLYSGLKDSINSSEIARLEMQYDFDKREKEQEIITKQKEALQQTKLTRQRMLTGFTTLALVLTLVLASVIFYFYREKKKINLVLMEQKLEIEKQKLEIENQRDIATRQRDQIADQQKLITDSIRYASRIQSAVFPREKAISNLLDDFFILYKPKNIVSGDFYWVSELHDGRLVVAVADCTGHGVPGAFMSMLSITHLKELTAVAHDVKAGDILEKFRNLIMSSLNQTGKEGDSVDGLDLSLAIIDKNKRTLEYAGAYLPILICRKRTADYVPLDYKDEPFRSDSYDIWEVKGNKMPIGYYIAGGKPFTTHLFNLSPSDTIYMLSDGYVDQFGGPDNTKFLMANFKRLLLNLQHDSLCEQKKILSQTIIDFMGTQKQVDDILILGFKI